MGSSARLFRQKVTPKSVSAKAEKYLYYSSIRISECFGSYSLICRAYREELPLMSIWYLIPFSFLSQSVHADSWKHWIWRRGKTIENFIDSLIKTKVISRMIMFACALYMYYKIIKFINL